MTHTHTHANLEDNWFFFGVLWRICGRSSLKETVATIAASVAFDKAGIISVAVVLFFPFPARSHFLGVFFITITRPSVIFFFAGKTEVLSTDTRPIRVLFFYFYSLFIDFFFSRKPSRLERENEGGKWGKKGKKIKKNGWCMCGIQQNNRMDGTMESSPNFIVDQFGQEICLDWNGKGMQSW